MHNYLIKKGTTDVSVELRIVDSTDGTPETGVVYNTAGIDLQYRRDGAASTAITEATLAALTTAHTDGGFLHIGNGVYRLDLPDAACASGVDKVIVHGTVTGMVVIGCVIQLTDVDLFDSVRGGMTALPNAAADAAGGLPISDAGGLDLDTKLANTNEITVARMGALTDWINGGRLDLLLDAIKVVTDGQAATGTGLTAIPWNAAWDAEVQSEVNDGLVAFFTSAAALVDLIWDEPIAGHLTAGSAGKAIQDIETDTGTTLPTTLATLPVATDIVSGGAITTSAGAVANVDLVDTCTTNTDMRGTDGANTTAPDNASIAAILTDTGTTLPDTLAALNNLSAAEVNAEVLDVLQTDTFAELAAVPGATSSLKDKITWLFMLARNQIEQTATTTTVRADDTTTSVATSAVSDDTTTATRGEFV